MTHRPEVEWLADEMERRLQENDHKGGWQDCDPCFLVERLYDKALDLEELLDTDPQTAVTAAADLANYAMMLADQARQK